MREQSFEFLEEAYSAMVYGALKDWRDEYYPRESLEHVRANRLRGVRLLSDWLPGGVWLVTITVRPRLRWQTEMYFTRINEIGGLYYIT